LPDYTNSDATKPVAIFDQMVKKTLRNKGKTWENHKKKISDNKSILKPCFSDKTKGNKYIALPIK